LLSFAAYNCIKVICRVFRLRHKCPVIKVKFKSDNCRNCHLSSGLEHLFLSVNTSDLNLAHWLCRQLHPIVDVHEESNHIEEAEFDLRVNFRV